MLLLQALHAGVLLGLCVGLCSACVLCYLRRKRRRLQLRGKNSYTPYGLTDEPGDAEDVIQ